MTMKIDTLIDQLVFQRKRLGNVDLSVWDGMVQEVRFTPCKNGVKVDPEDADELSLEIISEI